MDVESDLLALHIYIQKYNAKKHVFVRYIKIRTKLIIFALDKLVHLYK